MTKHRTIIYYIQLFMDKNDTYTNFYTFQKIIINVTVRRITRSHISPPTEGKCASVLGQLVDKANVDICTTSICCGTSPLQTTQCN